MSDEERGRATHSQTPLLSDSGGDQSFERDTEGSTAERVRHWLQWFLTSKYGHYFVIILVTLDVAGIFADLLLSIHICEHRHEDLSTLKAVAKGLGTLSLVFSCLFMVELLCSIYGFGFSYFRSKFHCLDATTIVVSFLVDVLTQGPVEEAGSLLIILRLFRVFKIVEESSTVPVEEIAGYTEKIRGLEKENDSLRQRLLTIPHVSAQTTEEH